MSHRILRPVFWLAAVSLVIGATYWMWRSAQPRRYGSPVHASGKKNPIDPQEEENPNGSMDPVPAVLKSIKPRRGAMERITVQVGSVEADEVHLYSMVTGILKSQTVLIGDHVKRKKELAVIDVPDLEKQLERNVAVVEQAEARVKQMRAKVVIAEADLDAAKAHTFHAEANARAASAWLVFRGMQYQRMRDLFKTNSVEERLVDETKERQEAARESENAAKAAILTSRAQARSAEAKILLSQADVGEAEAQVKIAQAERAKTEVQLSFATIVAPFDGVVTQRTLFEGATVRAIGERGAQSPLLTLQRNDVVRVVVQVPDDAARYADKGDVAFVEIDAFPGVKFKAEVSRVAEAEDPQTRLMRVEIDLPNPQRDIRQGMFGRVTIILDKATDQLSIPTSCLAGKYETGKGFVFVHRDGKVHRTRVKLGMFNDRRVEVLQGLKIGDSVILAPPASLRDGTEVQAAFFDETEPKLDDVP